MIHHKHELLNKLIGFVRLPAPLTHRDSYETAAWYRDHQSDTGIFEIRLAANPYAQSFAQPWQVTATLPSTITDACLVSLAGGMPFGKDEAGKREINSRASFPKTWALWRALVKPFCPKPEDPVFAISPYAYDTLLQLAKHSAIEHFNHFHNVMLSAWHELGPHGASYHLRKLRGEIRKSGGTQYIPCQDYSDVERNAKSMSEVAAIIHRLDQANGYRPDPPSGSLTAKRWGDKQLVTARYKEMQDAFQPAAV